MQSSCSCVRLAQYQFRNFTTSPLVRRNTRNHYDSLGITPKATQADVKAAYYELSKVYHPDKNEGSDGASQKFRDISEAYEVLGNVKTRRLYDKGMSIGTSFGAQAPSYDRMSKFYQSRERKTRPSASGGRQPIYDFDEWSKAHYGATFARDMARKERNRVLREREVEWQQSARMERTLFIVGLLVIFCTYIFSSKDDYDSVTFIGDVSIRGSPRKEQGDD